LKILHLHSNFIKFRPIKKEISSAEECEQKPNRFVELVVLFTCIEKGDTCEAAHKAIGNLKENLGRIKTNRILIYPYAHLSSNLARPSEAIKVLKEMESYAKSLGIETYRAPFGWCKEFTISIKGHPLAEQFRTGRRIRLHRIRELEEVCGL
jgi:threonyl-tRNA synthetase